MAQTFMASDQEASSSNSFNPNTAQRTWKYDIFLSFRGEDTRKGFTDHLYNALKRIGFRAFRDDEELERGEVITDELKRAIKDSHFAIIVLSKNYASSSWCLNELQHIFDSRDNLYQQVFPIFYDVDPSHVRHQKGSFADAFATHQMLQRDYKIMESWRGCLTRVADLCGWDCKDQHEAELIDKVVEEMWTKLRDKLPPCSEELIGIDDKVKQLEPLLEIGVNDVRFVGIWGLGGVGKTTIARACFEQYRSQFEINCFLRNVRATSAERDGLAKLQSRLLSLLKIKGMDIEDHYEGKKIIQKLFCHKKVLLVLDDVSEPSQLENLANSPNWFGAGSRVIITTRYLQLLCRVRKVHEVEIMDRDESFQLFCQKAFGRGEAPEDLLEMSQTVCDYAKGLPLALSVLGSSFYGRTSVSYWKDALDMLKKNPHEPIFKILEISFDALSKTEQTIFLDIACFFNGKNKNEITQILESCGLNAKIGIKILHEKSLLREYDNILVMHDLLEQMGRKIVVDKSTYVGNRSRLWSKEEIDEVLENNLGTEEIRGMVSSESCEACWNPEAFLKLHNLRLLMVSSTDFNLPHGLKCLSHTLNVLHWINYPLDTLPSETRLKKLVDLGMRYSKLKKLWNKSLCSKDLKFLDLSYSRNLIETPDFSELPNLERLELEGCEALIDLHASIGQLKKLQVLNMKGCKNLRARCPKKLEMSALKELFFCGCIQLKCLPEFGESMKNLGTLNVGETNLVKLPESLGSLTGLEKLYLRGCKNLVCLPRSIRKLKRLKLIDMVGCSKFARLPENLNEIEALEELDASETHITEVPCSIGGLEKLKRLSLGGCKRPISNSWSLILRLKRILWGHSIHKGIKLPPSIFNLKSLKKLDLSYRNIDDGSIPNDLGGLPSLWNLDLSGNKFKNLPTGFITKNLKLQYLYLNYCLELQSLPQSAPNLREVEAGECCSLETVTDEQLLHLFASIDQAEVRANWWEWGETLEVTIPGSKIPSWFDNKDDFRLDDGHYDGYEGLAKVMADMPPCEEILGIGLCIVVDHDLFYSTEPDDHDILYYSRSASPIIYFDFAAIPDPFTCRNRCCPHYIKWPGLYGGEAKSSHLWIVFWKQNEELSRILQLSEYSQIPLAVGVWYKRDDVDSHAKVVSPMKCGWRVIRKADFQNWDDNSITQCLLPTLEQHYDQGVRTPMPLDYRSRSVVARWKNKIDEKWWWWHPSTFTSCSPFEE